MIEIPKGTRLEIPTKQFVDLANKNAENGGTLWEDTIARGTYGKDGHILHPGDFAPNLILEPPKTLTVRPSSWQVTRATRLSDILEPDMGYCLWGACR